MDGSNRPPEPAPPGWRAEPGAPESDPRPHDTVGGKYSA